MTELEHTTSQVVETTGENIEAALAAGLVQLGVQRDDVEIEVLDEGKRGVLGLGARDARVRLTLRPTPAPADAAPVETGADETTPSSVQPDAEPDAAPAASESEDESDLKEAEIARSALLELLALMGLDQVQVEVIQAEPVVGEKDTPWVLNIQGPGSDILIGPRGQTLAALQHITRLVVGRELSGWVHLVVDVEGFKARRTRSLHRLAQRMAEQAIRTDRTVVMEPMPPHERRIIHLVLRDHPGVRTESVGAGERRKVTIIPR
jgi:spoIIIJ-associated protein